jgi:hypothetical protein
MGQQIAQGLGQQAQQVQGGIDQATQGFQQAVQQGQTSLDQSLIDAAAANPSQFVQGAGNVDAFQKQLNAQYTGPTDFAQSAGYGDIASQVQNAVQTAQNASSPSGLQTIVAPYQRNPTRGMQSLDALLLQQNPGAQEAIKGAAQPLASLGDYFSSQTAGANEAAKQAQDITAAVRPAVQAAINPVASNFQQGLTQAQQAAAQSGATAGADLNQLGSLVNSNQLGSLSEAQLAQFGLTPQQAQALQNTFGQLNKTIGVGGAPSAVSAYTSGTLNPVGLTPESVASQADFATDAALESLLGEGYNQSLNPALAAQAGTWSPMATESSFNPQQYAQSLQDAYLAHDPRAKAEADQQKMLFNFLSTTAGSQNPGQFNYRNPDQVASMQNLLELYNLGLI